MGCAAGTVKYLLFIFNLLFFITGLAFVIVGILFIVDFAEAVDLPDEGGYFKTAPILATVIGAIILVIAFFGCCGAVKESSCMLTTYACILLGILVVQVAMGIYALVQVKDEEDLKDLINKQVEKLFNKYPDEKWAEEALDAMQQALKCCGKVGPADWLNGLPNSCCESNKDSCGIGTNLDIFNEGCSKELFDFLKDSLQVIGIVLLSLGAVEVISIVFAFCLSSSVKNKSY